MRYPRADWAANVPWAGITGKPANLDSSSVDLAQIRAQIATLQSSISGDNGSTTAQQWISKDVASTIGTLEIFQPYTAIFSVVGIQRGCPLIVNVVEDNQWIMCNAQCISDNSVRVTILNVGPGYARPGTITFRITYLANA